MKGQFLHYLKLEKKWKIEIPLNQKFNEKSKNRLIQILSKQKDYDFEIYKGNNGYESEFDYLENISCIKEATESMIKMAGIINDQTTKTNEFNYKLVF